MNRVVVFALMLLACTKARTSEPPFAGSAPVTLAPAAPAVPASVQAPAAAPDAPAIMPTPPRNGEVGEGVDVVLVPGSGGVTNNRSPVDDLNKQVNAAGGGSGTPASDRRPLVVVKSKNALDKTSLTAGRVVHEYVLRGQASVKRCFEALHAKDPSATGLLTLQFSVDVTGAVVDAHVDGFNREIVSCVQSALSTWTFTAPDKRTRFELVLNLVIG
jgi:hypothetical protein